MPRLPCFKGERDWLLKRYCLAVEMGQGFSGCLVQRLGVSKGSCGSILVPLTVKGSQAPKSSLPFG